MNEELMINTEEVTDMVEATGTNGGLKAVGKTAIIIAAGIAAWEGGKKLVKLVGGKIKARKEAKLEEANEVEITDLDEEE